MSSKYLFIDDKFEVVLEYLESLGFHRTTIEKADFIWTNLKNIKFDDSLNEKIVNHFKGSQHFSNKVLSNFH